MNRITLALIAGIFLVLFFDLTVSDLHGSLLASATRTAGQGDRSRGTHDDASAALLRLVQTMDGYYPASPSNPLGGRVEDPRRGPLRRGTEQGRGALPLIGSPPGSGRMPRSRSSVVLDTPRANGRSCGVGRGLRDSGHASGSWRNRTSDPLPRTENRSRISFQCAATRRRPHFSA